MKLPYYYGDKLKRKRQSFISSGPFTQSFAKKSLQIARQFYIPWNDDGKLL